MKEDKRKVVGNYIKCKATYVRSSMWCQGVYGRDYKDVDVYRVVVSVTTERKSEVRPPQTYVVGNFYFHNGDLRQNRLHLSKVKPLSTGEVPITIGKAMRLGLFKLASNEAGQTGVTTNDTTEANLVVDGESHQQSTQLTYEQRIFEDSAVDATLDPILDHISLKDPPTATLQEQITIATPAKY
jgi:hypothetical protein